MRISSKCCNLLTKVAKILQLIPSICILILVLWSAFVFLFIFIPNYIPLIIQIIFAPIFCIVLLLLLSTFYKTIFTSPHQISKEFKLSSQDLEEFLNTQNDSEKNEFLKFFVFDRRLFLKTYDYVSTAPRYCSICTHIKPDRTHHCNICNKCILKHDHHCPWVGNCVGFHNYKFFYLFLGYAWLYTLSIAVTAGPIFLPKFIHNSDPNLQIFFIFILGLVFFVCLSILFGFHIYLAAINKTTVENAYKPNFSRQYSKSGFHLGFRANMLQVFGSKPHLWFLPVFTSLGDGMKFVTQDELGDRNSHFAASRVRSENEKLSLNQLTIPMNESEIKANDSQPLKNNQHTSDKIKLLADFENIVR